MDQTQQMNSPSAPVILNISVGTASPPVISQVPSDNSQIATNASQMAPEEGYENGEESNENGEESNENGEESNENGEESNENGEVYENAEAPEEPSFMNSLKSAVESVTNTIKSTISPESTNQGEGEGEEEGEEGEEGEGEEGEEYMEEGEENSEEIPLEDSQVQSVEEQNINKEAEQAAVIAALERRIQVLEETIHSASDAAKRATDAAGRAEDAANRAEEATRMPVPTSSFAEDLATPENLDTSYPLEINDSTNQFQNNADSLLAAEASTPTVEREGKILTDLEIQRQGLRGEETQHLSEIFNDRFSWIPERDRPKAMQADIAKLTAKTLRSDPENGDEESEEKELLKQSIIEKSLLGAARRYVMKMYNKDHPNKKISDISAISDSMLNPLIISPEDAPYKLEQILQSLEKKTYSVKSITRNNSLPRVSYTRGERSQRPKHTQKQKRSGRHTTRSHKKKHAKK